MKEKVVKIVRRRFRINTGCPYTEKGQLISVVVDTYGGAFFVDHSRGIHGTVLGKNLSLRRVIAAYMLNRYENSMYPSWLSSEDRRAMFMERELPVSDFEDWSNEYRVNHQEGWRLK